jgi:hypothetical protein
LASPGAVQMPASDACSQRGEGEVHLRNGTYLAGTIALRSDDASNSTPLLMIVLIGSCLLQPTVRLFCKSSPRWPWAVRPSILIIPYLRRVILSRDPDFLTGSVR